MYGKRILVMHERHRRSKTLESTQKAYRCHRGYCAPVGIASPLITFPRIIRSERIIIF